MKRALVLLLTVLMVLTALPAFAESEPQKVVAITVNDPAKLFLEKIAAEYNAENEANITVEVITTPFDQFDQKIQTMLASDTQLDTATHNGWTGFGSWMAMDYLEDMTPYMEAHNYDPLEAGLMEGAVNPWYVDGKLYALPIHAFGTFLFYNKDLFDAAGIAYPPSDYADSSWTFEQMMEYARAMTQNVDDPINAQFGLQWNWNSGGYEQDPQYFGLSAFDEDTWNNSGFATSCNFNEPAVIDVYRKLAGLIYDEKVSPNASFNTAVGGNAFFAGRCAMYVSGGWDAAGTNSLDFRVGVAAVPAGGNDKVRSVTWVDPYWIFKNSQNKDATFQFIAYMTQADVQKRIVEYSDGLAPANTEALETYFAFLQNVSPEDMYNVQTGSFAYGFEGMSHLMPEAAALNTLLTNEFDPLFKENMPADEVCESVQAEVSQHLATVNEKYGFNN